MTAPRLMQDLDPIDRPPAGRRLAFALVALAVAVAVRVVVAPHGVALVVVGLVAAAAAVGVVDAWGDVVRRRRDRRWGA